MLIEFEGTTINIENVEYFISYDDAYTLRDSNIIRHVIRFYLLSKSQFEFSFKSKYSRDYNYNLILKHYDPECVLHLEDVNEPINIEL